MGKRKKAKKYQQSRMKQRPVSKNFMCKCVNFQQKKFPIKKGSRIKQEIQTKTKV